VGDQLTWVHRVPASLAAGGCLPVLSRRRRLHHPGAAPLPLGGVAALRQDDGGMRGGPWALLGDGPPQGDEVPGASHHDLMSLFPLCAQRAVACAEPYWRLPAALVDGLGELFQASWPVAPALRRSTGGPGAFAERVSRRGGPVVGIAP
jgi:hypothetical protein